MRLYRSKADPSCGTSHPWRIAFISLSAAALLLASPMIAEDRVTYSTGKDDRGRATVTGTIVDYTGEKLVLRSPGGGEQPIPASRVLSVQTDWHPQKVAGDGFLADAKYESALAAYAEALGAEPRVWAQRQILADCVKCLKSLGRIEQAGDAFLRLVQSDPDTRHFNLIPLTWQAEQPSPQLEQKALAWLQNTSSEAARLIGASLLLSAAHRASAIETLRGLSTRGEPRVASLAEAQLWRTRTAMAADDELRRWQDLVEKMPEDVRAGPYFAIGQGLAARGQSQRAALALMRVPILYAADDRHLAAAALLSAARELEKIGDTQEAASLYREILRDYADTPAAGQTSARLDRLEDE